MKDQKKIQIDIIQEDDAATFKQKVNDRMSELQNVTELTFPEGCGFCAMIKYEVKTEVPEDAADKYYLKYHRQYTCNDCPYLELDPDRRSVTHWCRLRNDRKALRNPCCDMFYEMMLSGSCSLVTPEERKRQFEEMDRNELARRKELLNISAQISKAKRKEAACERKELMNRPRYCYEFTGQQADKYNVLDLQFLTAEEIGFIVYGKFIPLTERTLIEIAKRQHAAVLWKQESVYDKSVSALFET